MEELVSLTIDGQEVSVPQGTTVLEAAKKLGIEIPTFCYHEKLAPYGGCRMCLVEIEKMRGLQTACTTPVREEMVVHTNSPEVVKTRRGILEFLLINHPLDCPVCDKGGECDLQDYVFKYGPGESRYAEEKRHKRKAYVISPFIVKDEERCILCRRCVRFLEEWPGDPQLDYFERGRLTRVDTFPGQPFNSVFSGNTIELCPVGALTSRVFRFQARSWELEDIHSVCPYCSVGCNIILGVRMGRLRRITARENLAVNDQWLCDKGRFAHQFVDHPHRLKAPLIKKDGQLTPVSWDEALERIAGRLKDIVEKNGAQSVGGIGSTKVTNEANYLLGKFLRAVVGTNNIDHFGRLPDRAMPLSSLAEPSARALRGDPLGRGLKEADVIFLLGVDPLEEAPIIELFIRRAVKFGGAKVIVANPRRIELNRYGGPWLAYRPGDEVALLNGLAHVILANGLAKEGFENGEFKGWVEDQMPEKVEEAIDVRADLLRQTAEVLGQARRGLILYGAAVARGASGEACLAALANLAYLTGSSGPACLVEDSNSLGALDMGLAPHLYPGRQSVSDERVRDRMSSRWKAKLPSAEGLNLDEMLVAAREGRLKALYVMGADLALDCPGGRGALEGLDFLVVQDLFLTETAKLANVVLPAASFAEVDGTYTNGMGRVQRLRRALRPPGKARPDLQIVADLAAAMGRGFDRISPEGVMEEIAQVAPMYEGINYQALGQDGLQRRLPEVEACGFIKARYEPPAGDKAYPFALVTGHLLYDRGTRFSHSVAIEEFAPEAFVELNPADAEGLGIAEGDVVKVASAAGEIELKARLSDGIRPDCVFVPFRLSDKPVSDLLAGEGTVTWVKVVKIW